jgi:hypothetical protein
MRRFTPIKTAGKNFYPSGVLLNPLWIRGVSTQEVPDSFHQSRCMEFSPLPAAARM